MATHVLPVAIGRCDANCFPDQVANQISAAGTPSVGDLIAYVLNDAGSDAGVFVRFVVPQNYIGTPKLKIYGILDGTPSSGDDLGFGFRKRAVADDEAADGTFDAEQTTQNTDISGHANEDLYVTEITLTAGDYAVGDEVYGYLYLDASGTTYAGNFLLTSLHFSYADV
jgi:hypothetical protein